jgi:hypothetical protein
MSNEVVSLKQLERRRTMHQYNKSEWLTQNNFSFGTFDDKLKLPMSINDATDINKAICLKYIHYMHRKNCLNKALRTY